MKKSKFYAAPSMDVMKLNLTSTVLTTSIVEARQIQKATWEGLDEE